jgi:hypothetical protein
MRVLLGGEVNDFENWLLENYGFESGEVPIRTRPPMFVRKDGMFDVVGYERWKLDRFSDFSRAIVTIMKGRDIKDASNAAVKTCSIQDAIVWVREQATSDPAFRPDEFYLVAERA